MPKTIADKILGLTPCDNTIRYIERIAHTAYPFGCSFLPSAIEFGLYKIQDISFFLNLDQSVLSRITFTDDSRLSTQYYPPYLPITIRDILDCELLITDMINNLIANPPSFIKKLNL